MLTQLNFKNNAEVINMLKMGNITDAVLQAIRAGQAAQVNTTYATYTDTSGAPVQPGAPGAIRTAVTKGTTGAVKELSGGAADKGTNLNTNTK